MSLGSALLCLSCLLCLAIYAYYIEPIWLIFKEQVVVIENLPKEFDGYRIALLSDFHYPRCASKAIIRRSIALSNLFEPDLVALVGDFCDKNRNEPRKVPALKGLFDSLESHDGIYGVLGNHDHWLDAEGIRNELQASTPITLLENRCVTVVRNNKQIAIGGVGDLWEGIVLPKVAFQEVDEETPKILLSHNPDLAEERNLSVKIALQLSGHTHGGQVCFLGHAFKIPSKYGNKYRAGLVHGKSYPVYITRGVGTLRHIRFGCRPEVTGIVLRCEQE